MTLRKKIKHLKSVYRSLQENLFTKDYAFVSFCKYIYVNYLLYFLNREVTFAFLEIIWVKAKKGDGIIGNYHSILQEPNESLFLLHYLSQTDTFLDVGANVGHYSLIAASHTDARIIAVEPVPQTFERLLENMKLNNLHDRVKLFNLGLSDTNGELFFTKNFNTTNKVDLKGKGIKVSVKCIDDYFNDEELTVIKIDVEGYEWFVLNGALETLKKANTNIVIIELNNSSVNFGIDELKVIDVLKELGFNPYEYDIFERKLIRLLDKNHKQFNTIFIKDIDLVECRINKGKKIKVQGRYY